MFSMTTFTRLFFWALEKRDIFSTTLERLYKEEGMHVHDVNSNTLSNLIHKALSKCKRSKQRKSETNSFPTNVRFDQECKVARRKLRESNKTSLDIKVCKNILKKKKMILWSQEEKN